MLVVQATPYCNLNCAYCYLPTRELRDRISTETLHAIFKRVFESELAQKSFMILWHAGEPFTVPPSFYEEAFKIVDQYNTKGVQVRHSFQTNATVVTDEWCEFLKRHNASLGVSIDGPEFLHDKNRRTRGGRGTFHQVVKGIRKLQSHKIPFGVISVLSKGSLECPDELYDFYCDYDIRMVGFNVEEVEGTHADSSMLGLEMREKLQAFLRRFYHLVYDGDRPMKVREFRRFAPLLAGVAPETLHEPSRRISNSEVQPFQFINVDYKGRFGTFSPELLGVKSADYGDFYLGNVHEHSFAEAARSEKFLKIHASVAAGVRRCEESCRYFGYCGGGAPVNKYFENGSFDSTESMHCRLSRQTTVDVVLERLLKQPTDKSAKKPSAQQLIS